MREKFAALQAKKKDLQLKKEGDASQPPLSNLFKPKQNTDLIED